MPIHQTVTKTNPLPVQSVGAGTTHHGATMTERSIPVVAASGVYNLIPSNFRTFTAGDGAAVAEDRMFKVSCGTALANYGTIQSFRSINYRTGGSAALRVSARFPDPQALTWTGVGGVSLGDEISFGYNGTTFGCWHRRHGLAEVRTFQFTADSDSSENATVFINGTEYTVALTSGNVQHNAHELSEYVNANVDGFDAEQIDDSTIISASSDGAKSGTWSFSAGEAAVTITRTTTGVTKTSDHIPQSSWNGDTIEDFDPAMGNNYEIRFSNGFGNIEFLIEDAVTLQYVCVHTIKYANMQTETNLGNPSLRVSCYSTSIGSTTNVDVFVSYLSGFVTSGQERIRNPRTVEADKSIGTTETAIFTLRNRRIYNGIVNQAELEPAFITLSNDTGKQAVFRIIGNPALDGESNFQEIGTNLIALIDTASTTYNSGGRILATFVVARLSSISVDLSSIMIRVPPTLNLTVTGRKQSGAADDMSAAITFYADIY